jgi:hypothetical protein
MKTECASGLRFLNSHGLIGFALFAAGLVSAFSSMSSAAAGDDATAELSPLMPAQAPGRWKATGSMSTARDFHTATLLPNRQVLVTGGSGDTSAELYDPATGTWTATGSLAIARYFHTATLLPNGQVLVAGGDNIQGTYYPSAELYDPATGTWTATGSMANARAVHTATLLPNGQVLVAGGYGPGTYIASAELTIRRLGCGRRPAAWPLHVPHTGRHCCRMARCW